jgi:hypothetical protein
LLERQSIQSEAISLEQQRYGNLTKKRGRLKAASCYLVDRNRVTNVILKWEVCCKRIGLEAGPLSQRLFSALAEAE